MTKYFKRDVVNINKVENSSSNPNRHDEPNYHHADADTQRR
jgi:hypothetical protein